MNDPASQSAPPIGDEPSVDGELAAEGGHGSAVADEIVDGVRPEPVTDAPAHDDRVADDGVTDESAAADGIDPELAARWGQWVETSGSPGTDDEAASGSGIEQPVGDEMAEAPGSEPSEVAEASQSGPTEMASAADTWSVPARATVFEPTGEQAVDRALEALGGIDELPLSEHGAAYESAHRLLQEALSEVEDDQAPSGTAPQHG